MNQPESRLIAGSKASNRREILAEGGGIGVSGGSWDADGGIGSTEEAGAISGGSGSSEDLPIGSFGVSDMTDKRLHNNAEFIYEYTEKTVQQINRSIDIGTDKLAKILAFSGILLKFSADMPSEGYLFATRFLTIGCITASIGLCSAGLWPKESSKNLPSPEWLLEEQYGLSEDKMHVMLTRCLINITPSLKQTRDYRLGVLNAAIGFLVAAGFLFAISAVISSIQ